MKSYIFFLLLMIFIASPGLAGDSTQITPSTGLNSTNTVHIIAKITPSSTFADPGAGNEQLVGYKAASGTTGGITFYGVPGSTTSTSSGPTDYITVPYAGNYKIGGVLWVCTIKRGPLAYLSLEIIASGTSPVKLFDLSDIEFCGGVTAIDVGQTFGLDNLYLPQGAKIYVYAHTYIKNYINVYAYAVYIYPPSYISVDSVSQ